MGYAFFFDLYSQCGGVMSYMPEDQQRINTFSKLNTRLRSIEEKIEALKVRPAES